MAESNATLAKKGKLVELLKLAVADKQLAGQSPSPPPPPPPTSPLGATDHPATSESSPDEVVYVFDAPLVVERGGGSRVRANVNSGGVDFVFQPPRTVKAENQTGWNAPFGSKADAVEDAAALGTAAVMSSRSAEENLRPKDTADVEDSGNGGGGGGGSGGSGGVTAAAAPDSVITVNVGGVLFSTLCSTFRSATGACLCVMVCPCVCLYVFMCARVYVCMFACASCSRSILANACPCQRPSLPTNHTTLHSRDILPRSGGRHICTDAG